MVGVQIVLYALVGGEGRVWGPFVGACVLVPFVEYTRGTIGTRFSGADLMIMGAVMILVMMFMPGGILGLVDSVRKRFSPRRTNGQGLTPEREDEAALHDLRADREGGTA